MTHAQTIVALATAPLAAGVAIIRLSGTHAWEAAATLAPKLLDTAPRSALFSQLTFKNTPLDEALTLKFKAPNSFTGEDVVEFQCHGSMAVVESVLNALLTHPQVRMATKGEFTRRAVENGKLDLTAAEGLCDLIAANTEAQRKQALNQLQGELGTLFEAYRTEILTILAHVEAGLDFPDEELDILADTRVKEKIKSILAKIAASLATQAGERVRDGFKLVIIGKPNAGKSTLTNLLTGQDTAIVSPIEGTTRDVVKTQINMGGFPVTLADTAGLRAKTEDSIEQEGIKRAQTQAERADIVIGVIDAADWPIIPADIQPFLQAGRCLLVVSKIDETAIPVPNTWQNIPVLAGNLQKTDILAPLLSHLTAHIQSLYSVQEDAALLTRQRHRTAVLEAQQHLQQAVNILENPRVEFSIAELLAQDLRNAAACIGTVTGRTTSEHVLDEIFSTFCLGK